MDKFENTAVESYDKKMKKELYTILVVDDDHDIGTMLKMMLEYKGYSVIILDRADKTKEILEKKPVDLILMDMLLSGVNGVEICNSLKKAKRTSHIPVVMISAHPNAREICLEAGANDFISKPFEMDEMVSKIGRLLNKN